MFTAYFGISKFNVILNGYTGLSCPPNQETKKNSEKVTVNPADADPLFRIIRSILTPQGLQSGVC